MSQEKNEVMSQYFYRASASDFMKIPGRLVGYWASEATLFAFENAPKLGDLVTFRKGMVTADNDSFIRAWYEVSARNIGISIPDRKSAKLSQKKWFPYTKGGEYRKWFGNNIFVVNWENDGLTLQTKRHHKDDRIAATNFNLDFIFMEGATYSSISSSSFSIRYTPAGYLYDQKGAPLFSEKQNNIKFATLLLNSCVSNSLLNILCPTLDFNSGSLAEIPAIAQKEYQADVDCYFDILTTIAMEDWNSFEVSWDFKISPLLNSCYPKAEIRAAYKELCIHWRELAQSMLDAEENNNRLFIRAYGLQGELTPKVPMSEITLNCNAHFRYGSKLTDEDREARLQSDTLAELVSYAVGCMMGRYSLDKPGLILASQGETTQDYLSQIPSPCFLPDEDAILPISDQEWFGHDATIRLREFLLIAWGDEYLQENLNFIAESLCLHVIKPKKTESSLETIRRYLSTQFYKDHLRTYKKRPIYWLFSSGKHKAFECLVYLHRYNEGTLSRMRMEYVVPLQSRFQARIEDLDNSLAGDLSTSERKRLHKELDLMRKKLDELRRFDEKLRHYADQRIQLDLDDGVKVNYGKFGDLLADVKAITGQ